MTNLFDKKLFRALCILSLLLTFATPIAFATGIVEFSATPNAGSGTAPKQIPAAADAPVEVTEAPEAATEEPVAATEASVEILPFDWDSLANYPVGDANIEMSEEVVVKICVEERKSGNIIAKMVIPSGGTTAWISDTHKFIACGTANPKVVVDLSTEIDIAQYSWIVAVKVGDADLSPDVLWSPIQKYTKGTTLAISAPEQDHGATVICMTRTLGDETHYVLKTLTQESDDYVATGDGWDGDVYHDITRLQVHNVQLACLHNMGENALNPGSSTVYFETDNFVGSWFGRPAAPK